MSRIQVGMMVRVVDHPDWKNSEMKWTIGKEAKVTHRHPQRPDAWKLDGLERGRDGRVMNFSECALKPINPDSEPSTK